MHILVFVLRPGRRSRCGSEALTALWLYFIRSDVYICRLPFSFVYLFTLRAQKNVRLKWTRCVVCCGSSLMSWRPVMCDGVLAMIMLARKDMMGETMGVDSPPKDEYCALISRM